MNTYDNRDTARSTSNRREKALRLTYALEILFIAGAAIAGGTGYYNAAQCVLSVLIVLAFARGAEFIIEVEYGERGEELITYYDFGPEESGRKNAIKVAAADEGGNIKHFYIGYISYRYNDVKLYPGQGVRGVYYPADRRTIPLDSLRSREQLRLLREEYNRRFAAGNA